MAKREFNPIYTFIKNPDFSNNFDGVKVTMEVDSKALHELLEAMECFIRSCGYNPKGCLEFVEHNDGE